jgi:hypothetical protein
VYHGKEGLKCYFTQPPSVQFIEEAQHGHCCDCNDVIPWQKLNGRLQWKTPSLIAYLLTWFGLVYFFSQAFFECRQVLIAMGMKMTAFIAWWWRKYTPLNRRSTSMNLHGAISQKAVIFRFIANLNSDNYR